MHNLFKQLLYSTIMEKGGQFYLIAAIIIVAVIIGIATVTNYAITRNVEENIKLYELSQELQLEGESVINYGIFQEQELDGGLSSFTSDYGQYINDNENDIFFIYGDEEKVKVIGYVQETTGGITLNIGETATTIEITGNRVEREDIITGEDANILVDIGETKYPLEVKKGQNFFFIIRQPRNQNVQTSPEENTGTGSSVTTTTDAGANEKSKKNK